MARTTKKDLELENEELRSQLVDAQQQNHQLQIQVRFLNRQCKDIDLSQIDAVTMLPFDQSAPPNGTTGHSYLKGTHDRWN